MSTEKAQAAKIAELEAELAKAKEQLSARPSYKFDPSAVDLDEYKDGKFKDSATGEAFQLKIVKDDELGRTHKLKNKENFTEMNESKFRARFEKL